MGMTFERIDFQKFSCEAFYLLMEICHRAAEQGIIENEGRTEEVVFTFDEIRDIIKHPKYSNKRVSEHFYLSIIPKFSDIEYENIIGDRRVRRNPFTSVEWNSENGILLANIFKDFVPIFENSDYVDFFSKLPEAERKQYFPHYLWLHTKSYRDLYRILWENKDKGIWTATCSELLNILDVPQLDMSQQDVESEILRPAVNLLRYSFPKLRYKTIFEKTDENGKTRRVRIGYKFIFDAE